MLLKYFSFLIFIIQIVSSNVPPSFKLCPKSQGNREECVRQAIQGLQGVLKSGNISPEIQLSPGIDPLNMGDFVIDTGVKMKIKQYKAYGSSNFICEKVTLPSLGKVVKLSAILKFPTLKAESGYELDWKIGPIDIKGTGKSYAWFENLRVNFQLSGVRETRSGVEYIKIQNVKAKTQVNGLRVKFENLFNGNKALEDASNELINQNIQILIKEVTPKFEIALGKIGLRLANQVFSKIPADLLFPN